MLMNLMFKLFGSLTNKNDSPHQNAITANTKKISNKYTFYISSPSLLYETTPNNRTQKLNVDEEIYYKNVTTDVYAAQIYWCTRDPRISFRKFGEGQIAAAAPLHTAGCCDDTFRGDIEYTLYV